MYKYLIFLMIFIVGCQKDTQTFDELSNLAKVPRLSVVTSPVFTSNEPCDNVSSIGYPDQNPTQYLNPEEVLSSGKDHNVVFDHITTRKMLNVFDVSTLCNIDLWVQNNDPTSLYYKKIIRFVDIYNWTDLNGNPLFNLNYEIYIRWGYNEGVHTFPIKSICTTTGEDFTFGHDEVVLQFTNIETVDYYL